MSKSIWGVTILCFLFSMSVNAKVICEEPDGMNAYYTKIPTFTIEYDGNGTTKYRLKNAYGRVLTGGVNEQNRVVVIQGDKLMEGINYLDVWTEDDNGKIEEYSIRQMKICIDQTPPEYPLQWKDGTVLEITARDLGSGVAGIYCAFEGEEFQYVKGSKAFLTLPEKFTGRVCAYAVDLAGNKGAYCYFEKKKTEVSQKPVQKVESEHKEDDAEKPEILIQGVQVFEVTREPKLVRMTVKDNVQLTEVKCLLQKKDMYGEQNYELAEWEQSGGEYVMQYELKEEGIYRFCIEGRDESGNIQSLCQQIVFDPNPPIIDFGEKIDGTSMRKFQWRADENLCLRDLTSCFYEIRVDGILYEQNEVFEKAGKHSLQIIARDLAGNESSKTAYFYITKPKLEEKMTWLNRLIAWIK